MSIEDSKSNTEIRMKQNRLYGNRLIVPEPYLKLYTTDKPIILLTGGRRSGKSFSASLFLKRLSYEKGHVILLCRYTLKSTKKSVRPELISKIDAEGDNANFNITEEIIQNNKSDSVIFISGINTSSGNQTAQLKSIVDLSTFVVDEAEEWTSDEEYNIIKLSISNKKVRNRTIIIMNPSSINHFVFKKYFVNNHRIEYFDGVPVQISTHPDVEHIHTTYHINKDNLSNEFLHEIQRIKEEQPDRYRYEVIGRWNDFSENNTLFKWDKITDVFTNHITPINKWYIVCDAAKYGRDLCVIMVWKGWEVMHTSILKKSDVHDITTEIEKLRLKFKVPKSQTLVDGDGVGADTVKMGQYKSFHGGHQPFKVGIVKENYKNLKSQLAFYLAENHINIGEIKININNQTCSIDGRFTTKIKIGIRVVDVRDLIMEDLRAIHIHDIDGDGKKQINPKNLQIALLGRSPDFIDVLIMRCWFVFKRDFYLT